MQHTMSSRIEMTPLRRVVALWLILLCAALAGCAGGSGSSGFDVLAENAAINKALDEQDCEVFEELTICAAGGAPTPTDTPLVPAVTATDTPVPTATETPPPTTATATPPKISSVTPSEHGTASPSPTGTAARPTRTSRRTPTSSLRSPTPTASQAAPSPTPTATEIPSRPAVDTNTSARDTVPCAPNSATTCIIAFEFSPIGLPSTATYYVAVRTRNPDGNWLVLPAPANRVEVEIDTSNPAQEYQFAVLVFLADPTFVPEMVELLVDTGADSAFVTAMVAPQG